MSKPPDISSKHSPEGDAGDVSPGWRAVFVLGIKVSAPQWHSSAALPVLAEPGSPRRTCPAQELSSGPTYGWERGTQSASYLR